MKFVEVRDHAPPGGGEYIATNYPGNGVYLIPSGALVMVCNGATAMLFGAQSLVQTGSGGDGPSVDVHRVLDQMLEWGKLIHSAGRP